MDFEDNNPLGITRDEVPRLRAPSPVEAHQSVAASQAQRVVISEAGKSREGTSRGHITYTIRIAPGKNVRRRYSDFESLRKLLRRLFPCIVVPPIPEKHSLGAYAANPAHAHEDARIIEHRQRTLANFLNRCISIPQIHDSWVLERFLDPNTSWRELMQSDFVLKLPKSPLQAPPVDPASATPAHAFLPIPSGASSLSRHVTPEPAASSGKGASSSSAPASASSGNQVRRAEPEDGDENGDNASGSSSDSSPQPTSPSPESPPGSAVAAFTASENAAREYERVIGGGLEKRARKLNRHFSSLAAEYADLGGQLNSFSLDSHGQFDKFAPAVERVGQAVDQGYISTTNLVDRLSVDFSEPLAESVQMAATARQILKYRRQRELQVQIIKDALVRQTSQLAALQKAESEAQRMNQYLRADDRILAATEGLDVGSSGLDGSEIDRDHVVDQDGIHDRDHEITDEHYSQNADGAKKELSGVEFSSPYGSDEEDVAQNEDVEQDGYSQHTHADAQDRNSLHDEDEDAASINSSVDGDADGLVPTLTKDSLESAMSLVTSSDADMGRKVSGSSLRRGFKLPGLSHINHAIHGIMDVDPQAARRNNITRVQERIQQLRAALEIAEQDAAVAAREVSAEIARYNSAKQDDIRKLVKSFVQCHIEWAEKNLESWIEAKQAIANS